MDPITGIYHYLNTHHLAPKDWVGACSAQFLSSTVNVFGKEAASILHEGLPIESIPIIARDMAIHIGDIYAVHWDVDISGNRRIFISEFYFNEILSKFAYVPLKEEYTGSFPTPHFSFNMIESVHYNDVVSRKITMRGTPYSSNFIFNSRAEEIEEIVRRINYDYN